MVPDSVSPFPDDAFRRVLCVVAHPDDVEYGISSAVAAWTARGVDVAYLLLTRGEAGIDGIPPEQTAQLRTEEQIAGSRAVGVTEVEFFDYPDGMLEYGLGEGQGLPARYRDHGSLDAAVERSPGNRAAQAGVPAGQGVGTHCPRG